jgi:large subunit ribosomal protein L31
MREGGTKGAKGAIIEGFAGFAALKMCQGERFRTIFSPRPVNLPEGSAMKEGIHPNYRDVVFQDMSGGTKFITRSTVNTRETIEMDGKSYPLFKLDITSESHPFYTGAQQRVNETGRVEKFRQRFARTTGKK